MRTPYKIFLSVITAKTPSLSSLLIFLYCKSIKGVSYTRTDIFVSGDCFVDIFIEVK